MNRLSKALISGLVGLSAVVSLPNSTASRVLSMVPASYSLVLPSSLPPREALMDVQGVANSTFLSDIDTLHVYFLTDASHSGTDSCNIASSKKQIENYMNAYDFPRVFHEESINYASYSYNALSVLTSILPSNSLGQDFFTGGHGATKTYGFCILDGLYTTWDDYFFTGNWYDLTCGSTSVVDPYSHTNKEVNLNNLDNLVRYFLELPSLVQHRRSIKDTMEQYEMQKANFLR